MLADLHVHTVHGSSDSSITPLELVQEARRLGLGAVGVTEHSGGRDGAFTGLANEHGIVVLSGLEVATDMGHIAVFGLDRYVSGIHKAERLRKVVDEVGGFTVLMHPFRGLFDRFPRNLLFKQPVPVEEAARHPVFDLVDEIEVANGACDLAENRFALAVARILGRTGTGGSDAHSTHGIGCCLTVFERPVACEQDLLVELRARRFHAATGLLAGRLVPFEG